MADEPTAAAKPRKKKGGFGRILMMTVSALLLTGAGAAGGFYAASKVNASPTKKVAEKAETPETHYFEVEKGFTSNLKEPDRYVEVALGVSSKGEETIGETLKTHDVALRSAILGVLAEQSADEISTMAGKAKLQSRLKLAINDTLKAKTGKAGVDDVYFTNFIVQ